MSLKAKIEAVIYAAEEPVTLAQLVGLLGHEAQAELDRAVSAQQTLSLDEPELAFDPEAAVADAEAALGTEFASAAVEAAALPVEASSADASGASQAGVVGDTPAVEQSVVEPESTADASAVPVDSDAASTVDSAEGSSAVDEAADSAAQDAAAAARAERARAAKLRTHFRTLLDELVAEYATSERGLEIREIAGGFRFATKPEYHDAVRGFVKRLKPPLKLTLQALETLAVVAYKQPVTSPEISEIRGVDSGGVLGSLMARKLITTAGRKQVIGRPILYKTTREFLLKFGLKDVSELPSIEEFEKMAGQLAEQEEIALPEHEQAEQPEEQESSENTETPETTKERMESEGEASATDPVADEAIVDGSFSGLPPAYAAAPDDPSAAEAEIQESGSSESSE